MNDRISVSIDNGVADVRLTRPDKMNALDPAMFEALVKTSDDLANDPSVRCVVLSGEGRSFCAGLDFASFSRMADEPNDSATPADARPATDVTGALEGRITHLGQQACYGWTDMPVPVIAAIHGHALGGGIQLALGADIRIVHPEAKMSVLEIRWGLIPDMTGTQSLIRIVGVDTAKELTWTGRMVDGLEAAAIGLATQVSGSPRDDALAMAREIAAKSPHAIRAGKRLFSAAHNQTVAEGFAAERREISALIGSPNQVESVTAFFEKRPPKFENPTP